METITSPEAMSAWADERRGEGRRIGLVPTMGFLHDGHLSLMDLMRSRVDDLVVSIYVNPLQFGPTEDLDRYPRDPEGDLAKCASSGVDALFVPAVMYPHGFQTSVAVHEVTRGLDGAARPGHFEGVATVVARLFGITRCDEACFGEKDWQQLTVIRRMVQDLAMPVEVVAGPLIRDHDGLALSSRNKYLSAEDRRRALTLSRALFGMARSELSGQPDVAALIAQGKAALDVDRLDYLAIVDADTLEPLDVVDRPARGLVAAFVGATRLIDNVPIGPEPTWI